MLIEESYEKRAQQPFTARFATGDPSTGDLSFWQFLTQKGWTGEGQVKFDVVTKYRQSAGWEIQDGRAYLGRATTTMALDAALPAQVGLVAAGTPALYEDFQDTASPTVTKWESGYYKNGDPSLIQANNSTVGGGTRGRMGVQRTNYSSPEWIGAGYYSGTSDKSLPVMHADAALSAVGDWSFELYTESSGVSTTHARFMFLHNNTGGYFLDISGADMIVAKLYKTSQGAFNALQGVTPGSDTLIKTFTAPAAKSATATIFKITRTIGGLMELFQDGGSLGTITDTSYTAAGYVGYATAVHITSATSADIATWITDIKLPTAVSVDVADGSKFIAYNNGLFACWYTAGTAFAQTACVVASQASNIPAITHVNARDIAVWSRDGQPTANKNVFLAACRSQVFRCYNASTQVYTGATTLWGTCVFPINSTTIVVVGTTAENSGVLGFEVIKFNAEAWTVATQTVVTLDGGTSGRAVPSAALDSSGNLYIGCSDLTAALGAMPSRMAVITSTDLLATKPTVTSIINLNDIVLRGVFSLAGSVYIHGARIRGPLSYATVIKYPSTVVWESTLGKTIDPATSAINFNHGVMTVWHNLDNVIFLGMNDLALWDPILRLDTNNNVTETASFASGQFSSSAGNILAVAEFNGQIYLLNSVAGTIKRTSSTRGSLGASFSYATLQLSDMGANTDLINKTLYSVTVELSAVVPAGETLSVLVNDTVVGTMVLADGVRKEIVLSSELTASKFTVKLRWPQASTWTGYIYSGPLLRYVPTQFKKRAWGFGIRATKRLKLGDGSHESRTPITMFADIEAAWASNIPLTFVDVDGVSYSVIVTDFKQKRPLLQMDRLSEQEAFYFIEVLEA